jgi:hypothetical protein
MKKWEKTALKAYENSDTKLFEKTINHSPDKAWPYLKYVDLIDDQSLKLELLYKSYSVEQNEYSCLKLIEIFIRNDDIVNLKIWIDNLIKFDNKFIEKFIFLKDLDESFNHPNVPKDFDFEFYINSHHELNLKSKIEAILHYHEHGRNEKRDYQKQKEPNIIEKENNEIILFTQYYKDINRHNDFIFCLNKNLENKFIKKIIIFFEKEKPDIQNEKIEFIETEERLSYKNWFDFCDRYSDQIKVLANSDVYFDETIDFLNKIDYPSNVLYACSRRDLDYDGNLIRSKICFEEKSNYINNLYSHDCWIFKNKLVEFDSNYILGYENCDVLLKNACVSSNCDFINLFDYLNCIHVDRRSSKFRNIYNLQNGEVIKWNDFAIDAINSEDESRKRELFELSIKLKPNQSWPYIKLADITKDSVYKISLLEEAILIDDNPWAYLLLIEEFLNINNLEKAELNIKLLDSMQSSCNNLVAKLNELKSILEIKLKNTIYLRVYGNLNKRIATLNSFYGFAKKFNKKLMVYWGAGPHYNLSQNFYDLFEEINDIKFISKQEYEEKIQSVVPSLNSMIIQRISKKIILEKLKHETFSYFGSICFKEFNEDYLLHKLLPKQKELKISSSFSRKKIKKNSNNYNFIEIKSNLDWQVPAFTEKQAFLNHQNIFSLNNKVYIACPWASIIDHVYEKFKIESITDFFQREEIKKYLINNFKLENTNYKKFTVCQHIYWENLISFWDFLKIDRVYVSHLTKNYHNSKFRSWHLIATNIENPKRNIGISIKPNSQKKYLCSFMGAYNQKYRSNIRQKLYEIYTNNKDLHEKIKIEIGEKWFFYDLVYESYDDVILNQNIYDSIRYNEIMSDSLFSLCPEGTGPNTIRLWESMALGVVPVLFENDWKRPKIKNMKWDDFSITIKKEQTNDVFNILQNISNEKIELMKLNCINAYNSIRTRTCF